MDKVLLFELIIVGLVGITFFLGTYVYEANIRTTFKDIPTGFDSGLDSWSRRQPVMPATEDRNNQPSHNQKAGYKGYVFGWDYYEAQTCAARNLLGLQHWAGTLGFGVVEPFVCNSHYRANNFLRSGKSLRFSNYFNITEWNQQVATMNYGKPLVTWEQFLEKASRQVIVVYVVISQPKTSVYVDEAITENCLSSSRGFTIKTLTPFNFTLVRQVCFEFNVHFPLSVNDFNRHIFGNFSKASLVFTFAPGVFAARINLKETEFYHKGAGWLYPSEHVVEHSKNYVEKFLKNGNYVAVAVRSVKLGVSLVKGQKMSKEWFANFLNNCSNEISGLLSNFSERRFLTLDIGRFGDPKATAYMSPATVNHFIASMVSVVYNMTWNSDQWEQSFVTATGGISDSGYIALVQKAIVTRATNVITAGSGTFLGSMISNHEKLLGAKKETIVYACKIG